MQAEDLMVGIRRAFALLLLGFYVTQFVMTAWLGPDELFACYLGLGICYTLAFVGVAAEWFWARWFAIGVGNFGSLLLLVHVTKIPCVSALLANFSMLPIRVVTLSKSVKTHTVWLKRTVHSRITAGNSNF